MKKCLAVVLSLLLLLTTGSVALAKNPHQTPPGNATSSVPSATELPEYSKYKIEYKLPTYILADQNSYVDVTLKTDVLGQKGYDAVHLEYTGKCVSTTDGHDDGTITFTTTQNGTASTSTNSGTWGPSAGFTLAAQYNSTINWTLKFSKAGKYTLTFKLVDSENNVITTANQDVTVTDGVFVFDIPANVIAASDTPVDVTLLTEQEYSDVHIEFKAAGEGDVVFKVKNSTTSSTNQGELAAFDTTGSYKATTPWVVNFAKPGDYDLSFVLKNKDGEKLVESTQKVVVKAAGSTGSDEDEDNEDIDEDGGQGNVHGLLNALMNHLKNKHGNPHARTQSTAKLLELLHSRGLSTSEIDTAIKTMLDTMKNDKSEADDDNFKLLGVMYELNGQKYATFLNGKKLEFDVAPMLSKGRTLVPFRKIAEELGAQVTWNAEKKAILITKNDITIELTIGAKTASVNGKSVPLDVPAQVYHNRTLVPLRFISESLNTNVDYYPEGALISIKNKDLK